MTFQGKRRRKAKDPAPALTGAGLFGSRKIFTALLTGMILVVICFPLGCEKAVEEVTQPVEQMVEQKDAAALEAAVSNAHMVRTALMRYPVNSANNEYPSISEVFSYDTLREALVSEGLPADMAALMWDPAFGIEYSSDGMSFSLRVRALTRNMEVITATDRGVTTK